MKNKMEENQKKCFNCCPKCGETDPYINWGNKKEWMGDRGWQNATCQKCGCEFSEVYIYAFSEIDTPVDYLKYNPDE